MLSFTVSPFFAFIANESSVNWHNLRAQIKNLPTKSAGLSKEEMILHIKYGAEIIMAMKSVIGHDDLDFLMSASVSNPAPDKASAVIAVLHAILIGFSRRKPMT